jgi:hypothetical protein
MIGCDILRYYIIKKYAIGRIGSVIYEQGCLNVEIGILDIKNIIRVRGKIKE